jgi:hypothetical protein
MFYDRIVERNKQSSISISLFLFHVALREIQYFQFPCFNVLY